MKASHRGASEFVRYLLVGLLNTVSGYILFAAANFALRKLGPYSYLPAAVLSNIVAITIAFLAYKWFVFKTRGNYFSEWIRCLSVYSTGIIASLILLPVAVTLVRRCVDRPENAPYIAAAIIISVTAAFTYFGHKNISFRKPA